MKKLIATSVAALALTTLTASVLQPSEAAPQQRAQHVKRYVLHELAGHRVGPQSFAGADRITSRATHEVVGFDSYTGTYDPDTQRVVIRVGIALRGGTMEGVVRFRGDTRLFHGRILQGTGRFSDVSGTITGHDGRHGRTFVTLRYSS